MSEVRMVYCTFPTQQSAEAVARALVKERHAACVNLVDSIRSVYRWEGAICAENECLAIVKTTESSFSDLKSRILELHPYDCPEIVAVKVADGHEAYMQWIAAETKR